MKFLGRFPRDMQTFDLERFWLAQRVESVTLHTGLALVRVLDVGSEPSI